MNHVVCKGIAGKIDKWFCVRSEQIAWVAVAGNQGARRGRDIREGRKEAEPQRMQLVWKVSCQRLLDARWTKDFRNWHF